MNYNLWLDPFFYLNWLAALFGIYAVRKHAKHLEKELLLNGLTLNYFISFLFLTFIVAGCLWLSCKFGDASIEKLKGNK